jgi:hypothetical protein
MIREKDESITPPEHCIKGGIVHRAGQEKGVIPLSLSSSARNHERPYLRFNALKGKVGMS